MRAEQHIYGSLQLFQRVVGYSAPQLVGLGSVDHAGAQSERASGSTEVRNECGATCGKDRVQQLLEVFLYPAPAKNAQLVSNLKMSESEARGKVLGFVSVVDISKW